MFMAMLFFLLQLRALGPRGHKPEIQKGKGRLSGFLVLCLSGLNESPPLFFFVQLRALRPSRS